MTVEWMEAGVIVLLCLAVILRGAFGISLPRDQKVLVDKKEEIESSSLLRVLASRVKGVSFLQECCIV